MRGFKLDLESHDLALDAGGRLEFVDGDAATYQEIKTRILFFKGEGFTDAREGVPYFQEIFQKGTDPGRVIALIRATIASVPAVVDVPLCAMSVDRATRAATVTFQARTNTGRVIDSRDYPPLILG